jgi:hypothetical protein
MAFTKGRAKRVLLALDYLLNVLMGGWHDEWVSTRAWRLRDQSRFWAFMLRAIDGVAAALGQKNHCYWSAVSDALHRAIPPAMRE